MPGKPFLNEKRQRYALIAGAILWIGWLASILLGKGDHDAFGQALGTDFLAFYTGGKILADGQSANLYNLNYQYKVQHAIIPGDWSYLDLYVNPPFYGWLFALFAQIPYRYSALIWMGLGLVAIGIGTRWLGVPHPKRAFAWGLTFCPIFAGVSFGQNAPLSLALFGLTYVLWHKERRFMAGLASSLLLYKPQLLIGLGLLWLLEWRRERNTITGLATGGITLAAISFGFTPRASLAYIRNSQYLLSDYPPWHAYATRTFWLNLLPGVPVLPNILYFLGVAVGIWMFLRLWRLRRDNQVLLFGAAICLNLWITPHVMIYDWSLLWIPAVFLWMQLPEEHPRLVKIYAILWITTFVSGPLTAVQLKILPFSIQISLPVLAVTLIYIYRILMASAQQKMTTPLVVNQDSA